MRISVLLLLMATVLLVGGCRGDAEPVRHLDETANPVSNKIRCAEIGWKFMDRLKQEEAKEGHSAYLEVRYAYNPALQTCLSSYERMFPSANPPFSHFVIWDTLSGKMLAHATTVNQATIAPFEAKWQQLMGIEREDDVLRGVPLGSENELP